MMQTDIQKIWAIHANKALQAHIMKRRMGGGFCGQSFDC